MKISAGCGALFALLLLVVLPAHGVVPITDLAQPVSIAGQWQFQIGDDPTWAAAGLDDSSWQSTAVPAHAPIGHAGYSGILWYRYSLQLDLSQPSVQHNIGALAITLGDVMSAYEIYAGGKRLGGIGKVRPEPEAAYDRRQTWNIPASAIGAEGELVLAMRVWRDPSIGIHQETGPNGGDFLLGNVGDLRERMLLKALMPNVVLAALYLVLGIYHLLIARRNPVLKEFFWFGLFSLVLAAYTLETSQSKFFIAIPFDWHKTIEFLLLYVALIPFGRTLMTVTRTPVNLLTRGFEIIFAMYFIAALILPITTSMGLLSSFELLAATWAVSMAVIMTLRAIQGSRSARGVVFLMVLLAAAVVNDAILETPLIGSGKILYLVYAFSLLFIALMMAERYTDILKQLESSVEQRTAQLLESNRELEVAVQTKGEFLANMSHEMRTPMNAILGLTHLGLKTPLNDQQRDYLTKVEQSAEGLQGIIDSILDFSKLEEGQLECVNDSFGTASMVTSLTQRWEDPIKQAGLKLVVVVEADVPDNLVGDNRRLQQVLGNFISNAVKFTDRGQVKLLVSLVDVNNRLARLHFAVSDTGAGIADDQRDQLFAAFSQADNSMTRQHGGTGLGLSIAQKLVELMGGGIELESIPGEGSTFSFELDLPIGEGNTENKNDSAELDLTPIFGAKVLLVDDADLNLQVAGELLRQARLYVDTAHDGKEAVEKVNSASYDCVLMDVQMPVMDGYTATATIRANPNYKDLPILAMTANAMPQDRARGAEAGMNAYIPKPIDPQDLYRALLQWIKPGERDYDSVDIASPETQANAQDDLPTELPGINVSEGMTRVGGNTVLYLSLLQDLCKDYADVASRIATMLDDGEIESACQLAHKLRGIANNLGANDVGLAAEAIELPLKSGEPLAPDAVPLLAKAIALIGESQLTLAPLLVVNEQVVGLDEHEQQALFSDLLEAVAENNPEAIELAEKLLASLVEGADGFVELSQARDALDMYDFAAASELLPAALS
jgi:signal transduction histidine kinase/CheY-like chemotaxis protein/HPt (histidine-containing phosphotransfer) domain-containing protein